MIALLLFGSGGQNSAYKPSSYLFFAERSFDSAAEHR